MCAFGLFGQLIAVVSAIVMFVKTQFTRNWLQTERYFEKLEEEVQRQEVFLIIDDAKEDRWPQRLESSRVF
jgi:hypothetical protein